jgi:hypothetical protein
VFRQTVLVEISTKPLNASLRPDRAFILLKSRRGGSGTFGKIAWPLGVSISRGNSYGLRGNPPAFDTTQGIIHGSNGVLWCGNVVTDPFRILVRVIGPIAAICTLALGIRCYKARRWSLSAIVVLLVFALTTAALARQAWILERDYGFDGLCNAFWWLPRF